MMISFLIASICQTHLYGNGNIWLLLTMKALYHFCSLSSYILALSVFGSIWF